MDFEHSLSSFKSEIFSLEAHSQISLSIYYDNHSASSLQEPSTICISVVCVYVWSSRAGDWVNTGHIYNPACGELNRENVFSLDCVSPFVPESLASQDRFVFRQLNLMLFTDSFHLSRFSRRCPYTPTINRHRASPEPADQVT